jgi:hypothetical protein
MTTFAFPSVYEDERSSAANNDNSQGMTLKDWFAGQIIAAMLSSDASSAVQRDENGRLCAFDKSRLANLAKNAYQAAGALMDARAAGKDEA